MAPQSRSITQVTPDPTALKALAHPVRLRMLGILRIDGPATASGLAARLGLNSGSTSYHLRQLALHGFIVDDTERGNARDRWWRAAHESTSFGEGDGGDAALEAGVAFGQVALNWQVSQMQRALQRHTRLTPEWRKASTLFDFNILLSAGQAEKLMEEVQALIWQAMENAPRPGDLLQDGVEPFTVILHAFPLPPEEEAGR